MNRACRARGLPKPHWSCDLSPVTKRWRPETSRHCLRDWFAVGHCPAECCSDQGQQGRWKTEMGTWQIFGKMHKNTNSPSQPRCSSFPNASRHLHLRILQLCTPQTKQFAPLPRLCRPITEDRPSASSAGPSSSCTQPLEGRLNTVCAKFRNKTPWAFLVPFPLPLSWNFSGLKLEVSI